MNCFIKVGFIIDHANIFIDESPVLLIYFCPLTEVLNEDEIIQEIVLKSKNQISRSVSENDSDGHNDFICHQIQVKSN